MNFLYKMFIEKDFKHYKITNKISLINLNINYIIT